MLTFYKVWKLEKFSQECYIYTHYPYWPIPAPNIQNIFIYVSNTDLPIWTMYLHIRICAYHCADVHCILDKYMPHLFLRCLNLYRHGGKNIRTALLTYYWTVSLTLIILGQHCWHICTIMLDMWHNSNTPLYRPHKPSEWFRMFRVSLCIMVSRNTFSTH